jgi:hypothetical protein
MSETVDLSAIEARLNALEEELTRNIRQLEREVVDARRREARWIACNVAREVIVALLLRGREVPSWARVHRPQSEDELTAWVLRMMEGT